MKRLLSFMLVMLLLCGMILSVSAQTTESQQPSQDLPDVPAESSPETPTQAPTQPAPEEPEDTTPESTVPPSTEAVPDDSTDETTAPTSGSESCQHSWVYVEVDPTCIEYGAKGYVCVYCEAISQAEVIDLAAHTYDSSCDSSCNVCGAERSVTHKFNSNWSKNSTQHWHACTVCGEKADVGGHYPGPAATEEKAQYCLTCGLMMMPKKEHVHKYEEAYTSDEAEHWNACEGCEERKSSEPHSYDNPCDSECNVCGYFSETSHDFASWEFDKSGHWKICSLCGLSTESETHVSDGVRAENQPQLCSVCSFEISAAIVHEHEASENWSSDDFNHWKLCECGEKMEEAPHNWDEGEEMEDTMHYTCSICAAEGVQTIVKHSAGFPWWIPLSIAVLLFAAIALIILTIVIKKNGRF